MGKQSFSESCGINQLYMCYIRDQWMRQDEELLQLLCSIILRYSITLRPFMCLYVCMLLLLCSLLIALNRSLTDQ